ncbi:MAG: hypothetical protein HY983_02275 [Candidatus Magasanikbacteria bacterium]|nr:hypothetical protein [Candidatus Magasanikbacteria bacterium]
MLSPKAEQVIHDYLNLPFKGIPGARAPYFNNARQRERGQLRVLVGKGTPQEIVEEAKIISIQYHAGLFDKQGDCCLHNAHTGKPVTPDDLRRFLIDHSLGIECSGFVTQVLRAHYRETKGFDFVKKITATPRAEIVRRLIAWLRPVENINVATYANDENSTLVRGYEEIKPGDLVIMLKTGPRQEHDHILLITDVQGKTIHYAQARAWSREGKYDHGVARGTISITHPTESLLKQDWQELGYNGDGNETYIEAKQANTLCIKRLRLNT